MHAFEKKCKCMYLLLNPGKGFCLRIIKSASGLALIDCHESSSTFPSRVCLDRLQMGATLQGVVARDLTMKSLL
jgi:hypothetical protein